MLHLESWRSRLYANNIRGFASQLPIYGVFSIFSSECECERQFLFFKSIISPILNMPAPWFEVMIEVIRACKTAYRNNPKYYLPNSTSRFSSLEYFAISLITPSSGRCNAAASTEGTIDIGIPIIPFKVFVPDEFSPHTACLLCTRQHRLLHERPSERLGLSVWVLCLHLSPPSISLEGKSEDEKKENSSEHDSGFWMPT